MQSALRENIFQDEIFLIQKGATVWPRPLCVKPIDGFLARHLPLAIDQTRNVQRVGILNGGRKQRIREGLIGYWTDKAFDRK